MGTQSIKIIYRSTYVQSNANIYSAYITVSDPRSLSDNSYTGSIFGSYGISVGANLPGSGGQGGNTLDDGTEDLGEGIKGICRGEEFHGGAPVVA